MRKLATIEKILGLQPIKDADRIEVATIRGWEVVVKKGEFEIGDKCVYFEIDSFLPIEDRYEFLRKSCYRKYRDGTGEGFRLRTIKLKGQISQGLALPLDLYTEFHRDLNHVGEDVTTILDVALYDPPIPAQLRGSIKGNFPSFIRKTDQDRIQNHLDYFAKYKDEEFEVTVKLDGTSMTVYYNNGEFGVCSRNLEIKENKDNAYWKIVDELNLKEKMRKYGWNIALQGELIGAGIQGNPEKIKGQEFRLFDIYDIDLCRYFTPRERDFGRLLFPNVLTVPIECYCYDILADYHDLDLLLAFADEGRSLNADVREGLVFKSTRLINGEVVSFKVINNKYLLENKK